MEDEVFDAYVDQILKAAKSDRARDLVVSLLGEFQEKAYIGGRHNLIDGIRQRLDLFDDRIEMSADGQLPPGHH